MKKKFRQITVDGDDSWAWRVEDSKDKYYYNVSITIWKDKKSGLRKIIWLHVQEC